jgi:hypothetical protein
LTAGFLDDLRFADAVDFMRHLATSGSLVWGLAFPATDLSAASRAFVDAMLDRAAASLRAA